MALTLTQLVLAVGARHSDALSGTTTANGTTTTIVDADTLWQPSNYYVNKVLRFTSGAFSGQERLITASNQANRNVTYDPATSSATTTGMTYQILPVRWQQLVDTINAAIRSAGNTWMQQKSIANIAITEAQSYDLPADTIIVHSVYVGRAGYWTPIHAYEITGAVGAYKLMLRLPAPEHDILPVTTDTLMRVDYTALPNTLAAASDTLGLGEAEGEAIEYVIERALSIMRMAEFDRAPASETARGAYTSAQTHMQIAEGIRQRSRWLAMQTRNRRMSLPRHI